MPKINELGSLDTNPADGDFVPLLGADGETDKHTTVEGVREALGGLYKIDEQTLGVSAASIDFQGIPSDYAALRIVASLRGTNASTFVGIEVNFNNDTTDANYSHQRLQGSAAAVGAAENFGSASSRNTILMPGSTGLANSFSLADLLLPAYADTDRFKHYSLTNSATWGSTTGTALQRQLNGQWSSTAAINRITFVAGTGSFAAGTRISLYGLRSAFT